MIDFSSSDWLEAKLIGDEKACKKALLGLKCKTHRRRPHVIYDYGNTGTAAHIMKCCCPEFADKVLKILSESDSVDFVFVDDCVFTHVTGDSSK
jgi:hypothetical protein